MTAQELITICRDRGIKLVPGEGGRLRVSPPPERLPEELREELRRCKREILSLLEKKSRLHSCGNPITVEEVDEEGRMFWTCQYCRASGVTPRNPGEPHVQQGKPSPLREIYNKATAEIGDDYLPVIDWLIQYHPERWKAIKQADDHLTALERGGSTEQEYHVALELFLTRLREAKQEWESRHVLYDNRKGVKIWLQ